jgi:polyisoprenoid-binding protein YceI
LHELKGELMNKKKSIILLVIIVPVFAILAGLITYFFVLRSDTPAPVSIDNALQQQSKDIAKNVVVKKSVSPDTEKKNQDRDQSNSINATKSIAPQINTDSSDSLIGTWIIDNDAESFVGYRVKEELVRIGTFTAVGRSNLVQGSLDFNGEVIQGVIIKADLRGLKSDNQYRDNALSKQAIETSKFPYAEFTLSDPILIKDSLSEDQIVAVNARGTLLLHGVSNYVEIALSGKLSSNQLFIIGSLPIQFIDYDIAKPSSKSVLSIEDNAIMEISLIFIKS